MKNKKIFLVTCAVFLFLILAGFSCFDYKYTTQKYSQLIINKEDLFGKNNNNLKDFNVKKDKTLLALSDDPWSYYILSKAINIKQIKIDIESIDASKTNAEIFFVLENGSWINQKFYIHKGKNIINVTDEVHGNVSAIRFDLISSQNALIKINNIIINSKSELILKYVSWFFLFLLFLCIIAFLSKITKKYGFIVFNDIKVGILTSCAISFLICIFAPLDLYFNNKNEFWFDIYRLFPMLAVMFIVFALGGTIITLLQFIIHKKLYQIGVFVNIVILLCSYIQGNYLTHYLPPLDGTEFNWSEYSSGRTETIVLWCIVGVSVIILTKFLHTEKFFTLSKYIAISMISILAVTICIECVTSYGYQDKLDVSITNKDRMEMSQDKNFIIILFDAVDSVSFDNIIKQSPEYENIFSDFTYYPNTLGAYSYTSRSIPFILSGEWFENAELFEKYNEKIYKTASLFSALEKEDYKLDVYENEMPITDNSIYRFGNVIKNDIKINSYFNFARLELMLTGFKYAPFDLKKFCLINKDEFNLLKKETQSQYTTLRFGESNRQFYSEIQDQDIIYTEQKCFKFIHIEGAHVPFRYDDNVNIIENGTYDQNIHACITIMDAYLDKLKKNNVYNNTAIIIMADHGYSSTEEDSYGRQNPLLMVKGRNEKHEMQSLNIPVSYSDLQTAYANLLEGKKSRNIFSLDEDERRERRYLHYKYGNEDHMVEYMQTGEASDITSMYPTGREFNR